VNSHFGKWNPDGFSNFQRAISKVKNNYIEEFIISLEFFLNLDV
jgi:hypothetical protein